MISMYRARFTIDIRAHAVSSSPRRAGPRDAQTLHRRSLPEKGIADPVSVDSDGTGSGLRSTFARKRGGVNGRVELCRFLCVNCSTEAAWLCSTVHSIVEVRIWQFDCCGSEARRCSDNKSTSRPIYKLDGICASGFGCILVPEFIASVCQIVLTFLF